MPYAQLLVEGLLDEAVGRRILQEQGFACTAVYGLKGFGYIQDKIGGFNRLAQGQPILALVDLMDLTLDCPAEVVDAWLPNRHPDMLLRVAIPELESWLLADRRGMARFLGGSKSSMPRDPERLADPKRRLINLARGSSNQTVRRSLVSADPTSNQEGPGYTAALSRFVRSTWNLNAAQARSESLRRCIQAVEQLSTP